MGIGQTDGNPGDITAEDLPFLLVSDLDLTVTLRFQGGDIVQDLIGTGIQAASMGYR